MDISGLNLKDVVGIAGSLPWNVVTAFVESRAHLRKKFSAGGFLLQKKNPTRFASVMVSSGTEIDFMFLFHLWHDNCTCYSDFFAPLLNKFREGQRRLDGLMDDETFQKLCALLSPPHARIVRCLCPVSFSPEQLHTLQEIEQSGKQHTEQQSPKEPLHDPEQRVGKKDKELASALKNARSTNKELENRCSALERENLKLRNKVAVLREERKEVDKIKTDLELTYGSELGRKDDEICSLRTDLQTANARLLKSESELVNRDQQIRNLKKAKERAESEKNDTILSVLGKLDLEKVVSALNSPDPVIECLQSVVKAPSTDSNTWGDASGSFKECLNGLNEKEQYLLESAFTVNIADVVNGKYFKYWPERSDEFQDLSCILSAKKFICQSVYEILRQYYEDLLQRQHTSS